MPAHSPVRGRASGFTVKSQPETSVTIAEMTTAPRTLCRTRIGLAPTLNNGLSAVSIIEEYAHSLARVDGSRHNYSEVRRGATPKVPKHNPQLLAISNQPANGCAVKLCCRLVLPALVRHQTSHNPLVATNEAEKLMVKTIKLGGSSSKVGDLYFRCPHRTTTGSRWCRRSEEVPNEKREQGSNETCWQRARRQCNDCDRDREKSPVEELPHHPPRTSLAR